MLAKADLHIHTTASDGRLKPEQVLEVAEKAKLTAVSITDHDTIEGYLEAEKVSQHYDVELIPGVEITASLEDQEVHILAYYIDPNSEVLNKLLLGQRVGRRNRIKGIIQSLVEMGLDINYDEVNAEANGANIGRPHVAQVLIHKGYVSNHFEAFARYLSNEQLGEIAHKYPSYQNVIDVIKKSGGAAVLAHPGNLYSYIQLETLLAAGLDGIECIHPSHNYSLQKKYSELTQTHSMLLTGGSDYHGTIDRANVHIGVVTVAMKHVIKMKRMCEQKKSIINI